MGSPFGTVGLTVTGEGVLSRSAISASVRSRRTRSAHLDLCDVLIAAPLGPLMELTIWWRSGEVPWVLFKGVCEHGFQSRLRDHHSSWRRPGDNDVLILTSSGKWTRFQAPVLKQGALTAGSPCLCQQANGGSVGECKCYLKEQSRRPSGPNSAWFFLLKCAGKYC